MFEVYLNQLFLYDLIMSAFFDVFIVIHIVPSYAAKVNEMNILYFCAERMTNDP